MPVRQNKKVGTWYYRFRRDFTDYFKGGYRTRQQAVEAEVAQMNAVIKEETHPSPPKPAGSELTLKDGLQWFFDEHGRKKSDWMGDRAKMNFWQTYLPTQLLNQVQPEDIKGGREKLLSKGMAELTVNHYHAFIKAAYNRLVEFGKYAGENPAAKVKLKQVESVRVRFLYPAEEKALTPAVRMEGRLYPYYFTAMHTGMRREELCRIQVKDVSLVQGQIFLPKTKTRKSRYVPLNRVIMPFLEARMAGKGPDALVLGNLHKNTVSHWFTEACEKAGVKDFTFHCLRHTFVANLLGPGREPIYKVAKIIGDSIKTTEKHYGHLSIEWLQESVAKVEGVVTADPGLQPSCIQGLEIVK